MAQITEVGGFIYIDGKPLKDLDDGWLLYSLSDEEIKFLLDEYRIDILGHPDINLFSFSIVDKAAKMDDLNEAISSLQNTIGGEGYPGDVAGIHFSDYEGDEVDTIWLKSNYDERIDILDKYLRKENLFASYDKGENGVRPFKFLKTL